MEWGNLVSKSVVLPAPLPYLETHLRSTQGMGVASSGVVDGPRAADLLGLLLFGLIWDPRLFGHLHHHRYVQFSCALSISPVQPPGQIPAAVSSIRPHLILQTRARLRRCMTYQSPWSITRCTIEADGKKEICIYVWVLTGVHDAMQERREMRERKQMNQNRNPDR